MRRNEPMNAMRVVRGVTARHYTASSSTSIA